MRALTITIFIVAQLAGCGLTAEQKQYFRIEMLGSTRAPENAQGDATPKWQEFSLVGVEFINEGGGDSSVLFDGASDPKVVRIANRPQLIYEKDVSDLVENEYSSIQITFESDITGGTAAKDDLSATLTSGSVLLDEDFAVEDGKDLTLTVTSLWGNTVSDETMEPPTLELKLD